MAAGESNGRIVQVKLWLMILGAVGQVLLTALSYAAGYATLKAQSDEDRRQLHELQADAVRKDQLEDIKSRLQRIENKLDRIDERARH